MVVKQGKLPSSGGNQTPFPSLICIYIYINVCILNRDSAGDDASQSFSMNYHTLAANEDDGDINLSLIHI